jgi:hypothetical protein
MEKLVLVAACATACAALHPQMTDRFTPVDKSFQPVERDAIPALLVDLDEMADDAPHFRSVGVIEVQAREKESLNAFIARAQSAGADLGCDVLLQRDAFRLGFWVRNAPTPGVGLIGLGRTWTTNDQAVWQFICGVNGASPEEAKKSREDAIKLAWRQRDELLDSQVCVPYTPLGTHVRKLRVCENDAHRGAYH